MDKDLSQIRWLLLYIKGAFQAERMLLLNQALHTLQHYRESAVDLSKLGMQSCVFYIQMV